MTHSVEYSSQLAELNEKWKLIENKLIKSQLHMHREKQHEFMKTVEKILNNDRVHYI